MGDIPEPLFGQISLFFAKAGAFVFGSGLAIVPFLYGGVVTEHHWLNDKQFADAVAVAMITPGPVVITDAFVDGITAAAVGAITGSVILIARRSIVDWPTVVLGLVTVLLLWRFKKLQEPVIVVAAALFGLAVYPLIHSHAISRHARARILRGT